MTVKRILIAFVGVIVLIGAGWTYYDQTHLRLTSTSPKNNSTATSSDSVYLTFNHDLDTATAQRFSIDPYIDGVATVSGNQLVFKPAFSYKFDTTYTVTVTSPKSKTNLTGKDAKVTFKVAFIPVSQQTKQQQQDGLSHTDSLEKTNPFAASLPYENTHFKIDYVPVTTETGKDFTYIITLYAIINGPADRPRYEAQLKQYKQEALDYIRSQQADPATLTITYMPTEAAAY